VNAFNLVRDSFLSPLGDIVITRVCLLVGSFVLSFVLYARRRAVFRGPLHLPPPPLGREKLY